MLFGLGLGYTKVLRNGMCKMVMFKNNDFEIMYFNKRVAYFKNYDDEKPSLNPPFSSVYVCHKMLPQQIVFEEINK